MERDGKAELVLRDHILRRERGQGKHMELYGILLILVDFSPTSYTWYCLPKPLFLYGSMVLLSTFVLSLCLVALHGD